MSLSFMFDTSKGETPQSAARKRALAAAIMGQIGNRPARNTGEGIGNALASIGNGISVNVLNRRADAAEQAGQESANSAFSPLLNALTGGQAFPPAPSAPNGTASNGDYASQRVAQAHGDGNYRDAIASVESAGSGDYAAIGPTHKTLGRALGRYQVMEANIAPWSKAALGREVTPDEFMANPAIQDAIFDHQFGSYLQKYGNPQDAASAWFTGQPLSKGANRRDVLGTSGAGYVDKFSSALGSPAGEAMALGQPTQVASLDPSAGMPQQGINPVFQSGNPAYETKAGRRVVQNMVNPQSMTGGQFMPMQGMQQPSPVDMTALGAAPRDDRLAPPQQPAPPLPAPQMVQDHPVAQAPTSMQMAQAQPMHEMAGNSPDMRGQQSGPSLQQLIQIANNPWLNDQQRGVVDMLLQQKMQEQDPMRQLDMDYKRAQIGALNRKADGGATEYGLNPIYGQDANGNPVLGTIGKNGTFKQIDTGGVQIQNGMDKVDLGTQWGLLNKRTGQIEGYMPKDLAGTEAAKASGKAQGEAAASFQTVEGNANSILGMIDSLANDPYLDSMLGPVNSRKWNMSGDSERVQSRMDQIGGQAFLQAFNMLRGGGQISNAEGEKATAAMSRLNTAQNPNDYRAALNELRAIVQSGVDRARTQAGQASPSSGSGKRLRFNPQTGELE